MNKNSKKILILSLTVALATFVLLYMMPTTPNAKSVGESSKEKVKDEAKNPPMPNVNMEDINAELDLISSPDSMLNHARLYIEGSSPMKGVFMMREITNRYPEYPKAYYYLGVSANQTSQYDKAIERLKKVIELSDTYSNYVHGAYLNLDLAYFETGQYQEQLNSLETWRLELVEIGDTSLIHDIDERINFVKHNLQTIKK